MEKDLKDILLKDLCSRLPYGVKISVLSWDEREMEYVDRVDVLYSVNGDEYIKSTNEDYDFSLEDIKPYLFPLSSMTEEQKKYVTDRWGINENFDFEIDPNWGKYFVELSDALGFINWCYENHIDINGLIPKGLSNDATGLNIY